ncbi:MAG: STAS domain-containing protein [Clostridia bacterium]|nr:STAS domain-containing protein [Clostridia bacterium]
MEIKITHADNLTIELTGRLDTVTSTELADAVAKETITEKLVIIDFKNLEYISSAGLRVLLALKKQFTAEDRDFEIHNLNDVVKEVFNVTGFINILSVK